MGRPRLENQLTADQRAAILREVERRKAILRRIARVEAVKDRLRAELRKYKNTAIGARYRVTPGWVSQLSRGDY